MAVRTRQLYCDTCHERRPFDKPAPNHVLHLLLSCLTLGLWLVIWILVGIADSPREYHCRVCGGEPSSLKGGENGRRGGVVAVPLMVFAFCALLFFYITWWIPRQAGFVPRSVFASLETEKSDAAGRQNLPTNGVWERLRAAYPELRGDRLMWQDVSGTTHLAVPQPFWNGLSSAQRRALGGELDRALNTERWEVVTGRYEGNGKMMLDHAHSRAGVLSGR